MAEPVPGDGLAAGLLEHPRPDGEDHARVLEHRQEVLRVDHAADRVAPAQEGFHSPYADTVQLEYRFVDEEELVLLEGLA